MLRRLSASCCSHCSPPRIVWASLRRGRSGGDAHCKHGLRLITSSLPHCCIDKHCHLRLCFGLTRSSHQTRCPTGGRIKAVVGRLCSGPGGLPLLLTGADVGLDVVLSVRTVPYLPNAGRGAFRCPGPVFEERIGALFHFLRVCCDGIHGTLARHVNSTSARATVLRAPLACSLAATEGSLHLVVGVVPSAGHTAQLCRHPPRAQY